jgi:nucleoside-diphosphate kinase
LADTKALLIKSTYHDIKTRQLKNVLSRSGAESSLLGIRTIIQFLKFLHRVISVIILPMERTLILLKPDAVKRGLVGEIITRFEKAGLKLLGVKMVSPDESHYHHHYETISKLISRRGEEVYHKNADFMMTGPVVAIVLEGINAVENVRKMVGDTDPGAAHPGTIRGDYAHITIEHAKSNNVGLPNLIHASGNKEEAEQEVAHWFSEQELFDYKSVHEHLTQNP